MATTKTMTTLDNDVTLTAGAANHTSDLWTINAGYGATLYIKITNGATGPTIAAQSQITVSPDNSHWFNFGGALIAALGNNVVTSWTLNIPPGIVYLQVVSGSNTGQNVTLRIDGIEVTAIM